jgi:hypothetical protein
MVVVIGKNVVTRMNELESVKMVILLLLLGLKVN